jgi:hypothetical protein
MNGQKEVRALQVLCSILLSYITNKFPLDTVAKNSRLFQVQIPRQ